MLIVGHTAIAFFSALLSFAKLLHKVQIYRVYVAILVLCLWPNSLKYKEKIIVLLLLSKYLSILSFYFPKTTDKHVKK